MRYITKELFLKADKQVQDSIMKWWQPSRYDIVYAWYGVDTVKEVCSSGILCSWNDQRYRWNDQRYRKWQQKDELIPLLTVGQLIEYLEDKVGNMEITILCIDSKNTLLEALWKEVQKIK